LITTVEELVAISEKLSEDEICAFTGAHNHIKSIDYNVASANFAITENGEILIFYFVEVGCENRIYRVETWDAISKKFTKRANTKTHNVPVTDY
jgi:hypothetical protein